MDESSRLLLSSIISVAFRKCSASQPQERLNHKIHTPVSGLRRVLGLQQVHYHHSGKLSDHEDFQVSSLMPPAYEADQQYEHIISILPFATLSQLSHLPLQSDNCPQQTSSPDKASEPFSRTPHTIARTHRRILIQTSRLCLVMNALRKK